MHLKMMGIGGCNILTSVRISTNFTFAKSSLQPTNSSPSLENGRAIQQEVHILLM
jgi:hypothetical protein